MNLQKLFFKCFLSTLFIISFNVSAETWTATPDNTQQGWVWWYTGQAHWTNNSSNSIALSGITAINAVNFRSACSEATYSLVDGRVQFSGLPSSCALQSIDYSTNDISSSSSSSSSTSSSSSSTSSSNGGWSNGEDMYNGNSRMRISNTHNTPLDIGQGDFAISFNIQTTVSDLSGPCSVDSVNNGNMIFDRNRLNRDGSSIEISIVNNSIAVRFDNIAFCGDLDVADGAIHDVHIERAGNQGLITIDGILDEIVTLNPKDIRCVSPATQGDCDIALFHEKWLFNSANHFYGNIYGLQIYNNGVRVF